MTSNPIFNEIFLMPTLSIIIPVYNEALTVALIIKRVEDCLLPQGFNREIIIINDGSTDGTADVLKQFEKSYVVVHTRNFGKGGAVRQGFQISKGDFIVVQDADLEQNPDDFRALLEPIVRGDADTVFGSRFLGAYTPLSLTMSAHYRVNRLFTSLTNLLTGYRITDVWTGYKMYSRKALNSILPHLKSDGIEFELEVAVILSKLNLRVADVAISYVPRWYDEGKKTNWKQAVVSFAKLLSFKLRRDVY